MRSKINLYLLLTGASYLLYCLIAFYIKAGNMANFWIMFCVTTATYIYLFASLSLIEEKCPDRKSSILSVPAVNSIVLHFYIQVFISIIFHVLSEFIRDMSMFPPIAVSICSIAGMCFVDFYSDESTKIGIIEESDIPDERYFSTCILYIEHVSETAGFDALTEAMNRLKALVKRIDIPNSDVSSLQSISLDISAKCIAVEDAINRKDASKVLVISREILSLCDKIEKRASVAIICFKEEEFYQKNNDIAMAQIDLILDQLEVDDEEDIVKAEFDLKDDMRFKKALMFAEDDYAEVLNAYAKEVEEKLKKQKSGVAKKKERLEKRAIFLTWSGLPAVLLSGVLIFCVWYFGVQPKGLSYTVNEDGKTVTITGYNTFCGNEVVIPEQIHGKKVTVIGDKSFKDCGEVTSVSIPQTVTLIMHSSFKYCDSLDTVYLPKALTQIQAYAFDECTALATVYFEGSEEEWEKLTIIKYGNEVVNHDETRNKATVIYDYKYGG